MLEFAFVTRAGKQEMMRLARGGNRFNQEGERAMRNRTALLIVAIVVLALLALGGTFGAMALTHSGFMGNSYLTPPARP